MPQVHAEILGQVQMHAIVSSHCLRQGLSCFSAVNYRLSGIGSSRIFPSLLPLIWKDRQYFSCPSYMPDFSVGSEYPKSSPHACAACTFNRAILSALHVTVFYIKLCPFSLIVVCTDAKIPVNNLMCQQWHLTTFKTQFREILAFSLFPPLWKWFFPSMKNPGFLEK